MSVVTVLITEELGVAVALMNVWVCTKQEKHTRQGLRKKLVQWRKDAAPVPNLGQEEDRAVGLNNLGELRCREDDSRFHPT